MGDPAPNKTNDPLTVEGLEDFLAIKSGSGNVSPDQTLLDHPPTPDDWWTLPEATTSLAVNERTLRRWIKQGKVEASKVQGPWGEEWRIKPGPVRSGPGSQPGSEIASPDRRVPDRPPTPDASFEELIELRTRLQIAEQQNEELKAQLQGATFRNGYLEAHLEGKDKEIKLLTDSQHKRGWRSQFWSWFIGAK